LGLWKCDLPAVIVRVEGQVDGLRAVSPHAARG
jgi:hypothetical protein